MPSSSVRILSWVSRSSDSMARRASLAILLMRQLSQGEVTLHLLERGVAASFDLADPLADLFPFTGAQFDLIDLRFDHIPDELPDLAGFVVAFFVTDRRKRRIFHFRKTKRDDFLSHGLLAIISVH